MKSEHRHELKTNELQRLTSQFAQTLQPYSNYILAGLVAVSVVAAGAIWWVRNAGGASEAGWARLGSARSAEEYANLADEFENKSVGQWARLLEAESHLQSGIQLAFTDRPAAISDLEEAQKSFEKVLSGKPLPDELRDRALYGLARTLETRSDGDMSAAIAAYERLKHEGSSAAYVAFYQAKADERIAALKQGKSQEFYAWFHGQNPKPEDRAEPLDGAAGDIDATGPEIPTGTGNGADASETEGGASDASGAESTDESAAESPDSSGGEGAASESTSPATPTTPPEAGTDSGADATTDPASPQ